MKRNWIAATGIAAGIIFVLGHAPASAQSNPDCLACHNEASLSMTKRGATVSLYVKGTAFAKSAHADLQCVSCHVNFNPSDLPHAKRLMPEPCSSCHGEDQTVKFEESVHARARQAGKNAPRCTTCHPPHAVVKLSSVPLQERQLYVVEICSRCHRQVEEKYSASDHWRAVVAGVKGAPSCIDCHGEHGVLAPAADSARTSHSHQAAMCMKCHADNPDVRAKMGPSGAFIASYEGSVHAKAVREGNGGAATCTDCHGSHEVLKGSDPKSTVSRVSIAGTCGGCHGEAEKQYLESVHGKSLARGVMASATCTDCHGEHNILSPKDERSPVAARNVSSKVCTPCHASVRLTQKYGLQADRFQTFEDSYHGLAGRAGDVEVANCASCHGVHDIMPSSDTTSSINRKNLASTCGKCHPGANENFTKGSVHIIATSGDDSLLYFIASGYIILIMVVVGGMVLHNILDFVRKSKTQLLYRRGVLQRPHHAHRLYLRMSLNERLQHGALLVSFVALVLTGFALRFPNAWWVAPLENLSPVVGSLRGTIHRIAAVMLVAASLYHLYYVFFVPRGRQLIRDLFPVRQDLSDALGVMKYNLGFSKEKPRFGRFSYVEKSEYWALVWGTVVMGATGVVLWFDNTFIGLFSKLFWDAARTVHYYEAWLATLAILVWHFYFVIFNPDSYPLNLAFWKGTLTEEEMAEDHPLELAELRAKEHPQERPAADGDLPQKEHAE